MTWEIYVNPTGTYKEIDLNFNKYEYRVRYNGSTSGYQPAISRTDKQNPSSGYSQMWVASGSYYTQPEIIPSFSVDSNNFSYYYIGQRAYLERKLKNNLPTIILKMIDNQPIISNQTIKHSNKTDFLFNINANDEDVADTLEYSVWLNNIERTTWTSIDRNVDVSYTIPYIEMMTGNNPVTVKVRDNNGGLTEQTFTLRNLTPESYSQKHIYDLIMEVI